MQTLTEYCEMKKQELVDVRVMVTEARIHLRCMLEQEKINHEQFDNATENYTKLFPN